MGNTSPRLVSAIFFKSPLNSTIPTHDYPLGENMQTSSTPYGYFKCNKCRLYYPLQYQVVSAIDCRVCQNKGAIQFIGLNKREAEDLRSKQEEAFRVILGDSPLGV